MKPVNRKKPDLVIRRMRIEDYVEVIELWKCAGLVFKPKGRDRREKIAGELEHQNSIFLVAEKAGRVVGAAFGTQDGRKGWINRVAVMPEFRKKGIARRMVEEIEKRLEDMGIEIVACLVEGWNKQSLAAFERMGYVDFPNIHYLTKRKHPEV